MTTYRLDPRLRPPSTIPLKQWQVDLFWSLLCLLFVAVIAADLATASTTGGKVVGSLIFGLLLVGSLGIWITQRRHPSELRVSYDEIVRSERGRAARTVLLREDGPDLMFVLIRMQRGALWGLAQPGGDTRLDVQNFRMPDLRRALDAHGWRVLDGKHPRGWA